MVLMAKQVGIAAGLALFFAPIPLACAGEPLMDFSGNGTFSGDLRGPNFWFSSKFGKVELGFSQTGGIDFIKKDYGSSQEKVPGVSEQYEVDFLKRKFLSSQENSELYLNNWAELILPHQRYVNFIDNVYDYGDLGNVFGQNNLSKLYIENKSGFSSDIVAASRIINSWNSLNTGQIISEDALKLFLSNDFLVPESSSAIMPSFRSRLSRGEDRFEVEPDTASDMVAKRYPDQNIDILRGSGEILRQKSCGNAVRRMRGRVQYASLAMNDIIYNFNNYCVFGNPGQKLSHLDSAELVNAAACLDVYADYAEYCFGSSADASFSTLGPFARVIKNNVGVLVASPADDGSTRAKILCTAMLVDHSLIVTAQHCLRGAEIRDGQWPELYFFPYSQSNSSEKYLVEFIALAPNMRKSNVISAITHFFNEQYSRGADVMFLYIDGSVDSAEKVEIGKAENFQSVILPAFQRLIEHYLLLKARVSENILFDDQDLLDSGLWREAIRADISPTCIILPFSDEEIREELRELNLSKQSNFGHTCQTLEAGSGGPILVPGETGLKLVGIHTSSIYVSGGDDKVPIERDMPKNIGVKILEFYEKLRHEALNE